MRKIVLALIALLIVSGLLLTFFPDRWLAFQWRRIFSLLHTWGGMFFLVAFSLYAWDHISGNRHWLRRVAWVTASGTVQALAGALLILTGLVLFLYGAQAWRALRDVHLWLTFLLPASIILHFLSKKS